MVKRKSTPFSDDSFERIKGLKEAHDELGDLGIEFRLKIKSPKNLSLFFLARL